MRTFRRFILSVPLLASLAACATAADAPSHPAIGRTTAFDDAFRAIVPADARIEKIAGGFTWAEGPAWVKQGGYLLFDDVPENTQYRWSPRDGLAVFLKPSGYDGPDLAAFREPGANGLYAEAQGTLLVADSGDRFVARLDLATKRKTPLATQYQGKRFNSPNDVVRRRDGAVFFTDPPYGLKGIEESPSRELPFSGVYRIDADGSVHLLDDSLHFPNGVALSPDGKTLYVSNSDPSNPVWIAYALDARGDAVGRRVFADASDLVAAGAAGLPDGLTVAADGRLFAAGPGGVIVFDPDGRRLGRIETGDVVSNCEFGDDGRTLYMTSHTFVARVRVNATGLGFGR
jgi:gluconolactonase